MLSTIVLVAVFFGLFLASTVLWALFFRLGLRWAKLQEMSKWHIVRTALTVTILQIAINILYLSLSPSSDAQSVILGLVQLVAAAIVPCSVISVSCKTQFVWAIQAWLPTLLASVIMLTLVLFGLRPFIYEVFVVPTNSMAPTLVGPHCKGTCSECGKASYCSPRSKRDDAANMLLMICDNFHITESSENDEVVYGSDRFMVAKFLAPQRWDLVVFQEPDEPSKLSIKRLVGLPGEKVHIEDGSVWIDDVRQTPPDSMRDIEYLPESSDLGTGFWGSKNRPAILGKDEYFVLGDFSMQSNDSRFWQRGASGHNPFAVPESHMKGVVTHTFWPPSRLRIHR